MAEQQKCEDSSMKLQQNMADKEESSGGFKKIIGDFYNNHIASKWRTSGEVVVPAEVSTTESNAEARKSTGLKKTHITREPLQLGLCVICENTATREITVEDTNYSLCKIHHTEHKQTPFTLQDIKTAVCGKSSVDAGEVLVKQTDNDSTSSENVEKRSEEPRTSSEMNTVFEKWIEEEKKPMYNNKI